MFIIKDKYKKKVVGFNGSTTPLGERNDLNVLAEIGVRSGDLSILELFKKKPTQKDVDDFKEQIFFDELKNEKPSDK